MLRLAFDFIITWRETRTRPNAYIFFTILFLVVFIILLIINVLLSACVDCFSYPYKIY